MSINTSHPPALRPSTATRPMAGQTLVWLAVMLCAAVAAAPQLQAASADATAAGRSATAAAGPTVIGRVTVARGRATARGPDGQQRTLARRSPLYEGDVISTGVRGRVQILFRDGARLALRPDTEMSLDEYKFREAAPERDSSRLNLRRGGFRTTTGTIGQRSRSRYRVDTPFAQIGVRGTDWGALAADVVVVGVNDGATSVTNAAGEVIIGPEYNFSFAVVESPNVAPIPVAEPPVDMGSFAGMALDTSADDDAGGFGDDVGDDVGEPGDGGSGGDDDAAGGGEDGGGPESGEITSEITTDLGGEGGDEGDPAFLQLDVRCL